MNKPDDTQNKVHTAKSDSSDIASLPALDHVNVWLFDLDNTLYPAHCNLFAQIDRRINEYVASFLDLDLEKARVQQKQYFREHGTTLRGLMVDHAVDPHHYMDYVHDIDLTPVDASPALDAVLHQLPGRKLIFTNGSVGHAENVTGKLGIGHHFEAIFDIAASDFLPKPDTLPYQKLIQEHDLVAVETIFFDDMDRNLKPAAELGMTTVWVPGHAEWSGTGEADHVHHIAEDVTLFLEEAVAGLKPT
jgi:putative hydrolase of the HAD superfamily